MQNTDETTRAIVAFIRTRAKKYEDMSAARGSGEWDGDREREELDNIAEELNDTADAIERGKHIARKS